LSHHHRKLFTSECGRLSGDIGQAGKIDGLRPRIQVPSNTKSIVSIAIFLFLAAFFNVLAL